MGDSGNGGRPEMGGNGGRGNGGRPLHFIFSGPGGTGSDHTKAATGVGLGQKKAVFTT